MRSLAMSHTRRPDVIICRLVCQQKRDRHRGPPLIARGHGCAAARRRRVSPIPEWPAHGAVSFSELIWQACPAGVWPSVQPGGRRCCQTGRQLLPTGGPRFTTARDVGQLATSVGYFQFGCLVRVDDPWFVAEVEGALCAASRGV